MASALKESVQNKNEAGTQEKEKSEEQKDFDQLICEWSVTSKKLLAILSQNHDYVLEGRRPDSAMALGALAAHLNMAIQAHKASESK